MGPVIAVINGPPSAGKSSTAAALRVLMDGLVCISGDVLRGFAPAGARAMLGPGSTYRAAGELTRFYLKAGASTVVFEYVFENPTQIAYFKSALNLTIRCEVITLWASLETLEARDARRDRSARQGVRVAQGYLTMRPHLPSLGRTIDTDGVTANEVAARIHRFLQELPPLTRF